MAEKTWEELLVWKLEGSRFDDHKGIELRDLEAFIYLRAALVDITKAVWKRKYGRARVPPNIEDDIDLRVRSFEDGCLQSTVWLGSPLPLPPALPPQLWLPGHSPTPPVAPPPDERTLFFHSFHDAAETLEDVVVAVREGKPIPDVVSTETLANIDKMAKKLADGEQVSIRSVRARRSRLPEQTAVAARAALPNGTQDRPSETMDASPRPDPLALDAEARAKISALVRAKIEQEMSERQIVTKTITGEVTMASINGQARILPDGGEDEIEIAFSAKDENDVTLALHEHKSVRLRARGDAELDGRGKLKRFVAKKVGIIKPPDPEAPSEALFARLATEDPQRLIDWIRSGSLRHTFLTYAVEIAGNALQSDIVVPVLMPLLNHEEPIVREGVIYGLREHTGEHITAELRRLAESDPSPGVRAAAKGALEGR